MVPHLTVIIGVPIGCSFPTLGEMGHLPRAASRAGKRLGRCAARST